MTGQVVEKIRLLERLVTVQEAEILNILEQMSAEVAKGPPTGAYLISQLRRIKGLMAQLQGEAATLKGLREPAEVAP